MATGLDKGITYDPPGAIGLVDREAVFLIRFDETEDAQRPQDAVGACDDFDVNINLTVVMPTVVPAVLGRGRSFNGTTQGLGARDKVSGATLLTRDMSIQVVLSWDIVTQAAHQPGVIVCRGLGTGPSEYVSYSLQLDVVDVGGRVGRLRWHWQDVAGVDHLAAGALVVIPPGQFTMLTATRRWVSPTQVELAYYVGNELAGVETSALGSIGGGTTGALELGFRSQGSNGNFYAGILDELMIVARELSAEEIEATWLRITLYQPRGTQLFLEMFDEGFPIPDESDSDAQLDIRMTGQGLGFAAAQIENLRANFLPGRAYGSTLEQWEEAVAVTPKPVQGIEARRARVLARFRQKRGISIPGLEDALADLVDCDVDDLEFIAFDNTMRDDFSNAIDPIRWDMHPAACLASVADKGHMAPGAGAFVLDNMNSNWLTAAKAIARPWRSDLPGLEHLFAKMTLTTPQAGLEAGIWFADRGARNYLLLGLRDDAGTFKVVTERFINHVSQGLVVRATLGGNPAAIWLHLYEDTAGMWIASWSTTSATAGFTSSAAFAHPSAEYWGGLYLRSTGAIGAPVVDFDDFALWTPNASRPFNAYVFRDPGLGGTPDLEAARSVIRSIRHAYTYATITESMEFIVGLGGSLLGVDPL